MSTRDVDRPANVMKHDIRGKRTKTKEIRGTEDRLAAGQPVSRSAMMDRRLFPDREWICHLLVVLDYI